MTPEQLVNRLAVEGLRLAPNGERIEVTGDLQRLTPELREAIRNNREGLLYLLELSEERLAIQQEQLASPGDLEWPSFEDIASKKLPPGWAFKQWTPAELTPAQKPYAVTLEEAGVEVFRVDGDCRCGSNEAILLPIHDRASLRKDCASCGKFEEFVAWGDPAEVDHVLALLSNRQDAPELHPRGASNSSFRT